MTRALIVSCVIFAVVAPRAAAQTFYRSDVSLPVGPNVVAIAVADLNDDGIPEIVTADRGALSDPRDERPAHDQLSFFVANGPLNYEPQPQLRVGFAPYALKIVNIDALRAPDIVAVSFMAARERDLTLLRNLGQNLFEPIPFSVRDDDVQYMRMRDGEGSAIFTTPGFTALEVFDFDGDGYRDAVATGWSSDVLAYFPGDIEAYFGEPRLMPLAGAPRDIAQGDFNQDGHQDLAIALYAAGQIAILTGNGDGRFAAPIRFNSRGNLPAILRSADLDADGVLDLVVGHAHADDSIVIFRGDGDGRFSVSQEIRLGTERRAVEVEVRGLALGDFDRNGRIDVAVAGHRDQSVTLLMNQPSEGFPLRLEEETYSFSKGNPRAIAAADVNGDAKTDLVVALWEIDRIQFLLAR